MYNNWRIDLKNSVRAFEKIKDTYLPKIISGNIIGIEQADNAILILLDQKSGIDAVRINDIGIQGIASRVQFVGERRPYDSFTIRSARHSGVKTEMEKRLEQIQSGYFYPAITLQAYFNNPDDMVLLSMAAIKTIDLYEFIEHNKYNQRFVKTNKSDNDFVYVNWDCLHPLVKTVYTDAYTEMFCGKRLSQFKTQTI